MKIFFVALLLVTLLDAPVSAGIGSCYEVRPLCLYPQIPLCLCDQLSNCFWVCKAM